MKLWGQVVVFSCLILYLIGFRNKVLVLAQWMWSYIRFAKGARLITQREWRMMSTPKEPEDVSHTS